MKVLLIGCINFILIAKVFGGCNDGTISWHLKSAPLNQVGDPVNFPRPYTIFTDESDTLEIICHPRTSCGLNSFVSAQRNGNNLTPLVSGFPDIKVKLKCDEGVYDLVFFLGYSYINRGVRFTIHKVNYVGLAETTAISNFLDVYPNPASKEISIVNANTTISEINIQDLSGRIVLIAKTTENNVTLNVEDLPNGVFFLTAIFEDKKRLTKKIIIN